MLLKKKFRQKISEKKKKPANLLLVGLMFLKNSRSKSLHMSILFIFFLLKFVQNWMPNRQKTKFYSMKKKKRKKKTLEENSRKKPTENNSSKYFKFVECFSWWHKSECDFFAVALLNFNSFAINVCHTLFRICHLVARDSIQSLECIICMSKYKTD